VIGPLLLAVALSAEPAPAADGASLPPNANPVPLDVPVTLGLKDAALVDLLEKMADLLGVTPIFEPGLSRRVSLDLKEVPVSKALEMIERAGRVQIVIRGRVMRVRSTEGARAPADPVAAPSRVRPGFGDVARFWRDGTGERPVDVRIPPYVGKVELPGCDGPVTIARLGPWNDGAYGLALSVRPGGSARATARILDGALAEGAKVLLPGCDGRLVVAAGDASAPAPLEPKAVEKGETAVAKMSVLEVTEEGEESVSEPRVAFHAGAGWSVRTGFAVDEKGTLGDALELHGVPLELDRERGELLFAMFAGMVRRRPANEAAPALVAQRAESLWLHVGRPVRWTVDSSWDGGRAALVVEVTLERIGDPKR
jgi:hypothetical protein